MRIAAAERAKIVARFRAGEPSPALAREYGVSPSTIRNWGIGGTCESCGAPLSSRSASLCRSCTQLGRRFWTPERVVAAARKWNEMFGRPPTSSEWQRPQTIGGYRFPARSSCYGRGQPTFQKWNDFIEAAGLPARERGLHQRYGVVGLGPIQATILSILVEQGPQDTHTLNHRCGSDVYSSLRKLENRGLVGRETIGKRRVWVAASDVVAGREEPPPHKQIRWGTDERRRRG